MIKFGGEKIKPVDPEFERAKKDTEWNNRQETLEYLATKFSELIEKDPIVIYTQHEGMKPNEMGVSFDKVKEVRTDVSGTGGGISVDFGQDWVAVRTDGFSASNYFDKGNIYYKMTKDSADHVIRMMNELIRRSGYSEQEKSKMSDFVFNNFQNKIIKPEDLEKKEI